MADTDPFARYRDVPAFALASSDLVDGQPMPRLHRDIGAGGANESPQLSWSGFPAATKSFAVTMFDEDAPTGAGFWHWAAYNIPASVTELARGAGGVPGGLPSRARMLKNEYRRREYAGAQPPAGTGTHRYWVTVTALDTASLDLDPESTPTVLGFNLYAHAIARGVMMVTAAYDDDESARG